MNSLDKFIDFMIEVDNKDYDSYAEECDVRDAIDASIPHSRIRDQILRGGYYDEY